MARGQARARVHQGDVPLRKGHRDPGRDQGALPRLQGQVDRGVEVGPGVTGVGVRRQRQLRVETLDRDLHHGSRPYPRSTPAGMTGFDRAAHARRLLRAPARAAALVGPGDHAAGQPVARVRRGDARLGGLVDHRAARCSSWSGLFVWIGSARVAVARRRAARRTCPHRGRAPRAGRAARPGGDPTGARGRRRRPRLPDDPSLPQAGGAGSRCADPADRTPYWLVSTRHPDELAAGLTGAAHGGRDGSD